MNTLNSRFLLLLLAILLLWQCGVDNDEIRAELLGSWILQQADSNDCEDPENDGSVGFVCSSIACSRFIFSDSSTYLLESTSEGLTTTENGTFVINGLELVLCIEGDEDAPAVCSSFSMILQQNILIINGATKIDGCFVRRRYARN